jgi:hypothetical protein
MVWLIKPDFTGNPYDFSDHFNANTVLDLYKETAHEIELGCT